MPLWASLTLLGMAIVALALAAVGLVAKAIKPYREARQQSQQLLDTEHQVAALQAKNRNLRLRIAYLNTTSGAVLEARKIGFMKPGEIPFVVETDGLAAPASPPRPEPRQAATVRSPLRHFWHRLTGR